MSSFVSVYQKELVSLAAVVFGFLLNRVFRLRPRLRYSVGHSANLLIDEPLLDKNGNQLAARQIVRTASITLGNSGLQAAKAVEVTFNWKPQFLNVWPARRYEDATGAMDRYSLKLDSLAPSEQFTIEIMSINGELPVMTAVRSEDCVGKLVPMSVQREWPAWFNNLGLVLILLGAASAVYMLASIIQVIGRG